MYELKSQNYIHLCYRHFREMSTLLVPFANLRSYIQFYKGNRLHLDSLEHQSSHPLLIEQISLLKSILHQKNKQSRIFEQILCISQLKITQQILQKPKYFLLFYLIQLSLMLTRSKVKMEESIRHIKPDLPYFNAPHSLTHVRSQTQLRTQTQDFQESNRGQPLTRNQILKQLRQEYQILKSLPIEENLGTYSKAQFQQEKARFSQSSISSSVRSQRVNILQESAAQSPRVTIKELQAVHLEKKQLEIVIGNSMRKIDELLGNEIILKKTIHELKNQIEGKGGVHQQYQKAIKAIQKSNDELQQELNAALKENDKNAQRIRDQTDKNRQLEIEIANRDRQIKIAFEEQRKLHEQIRAEKDRSMNLEVQCRSFKVELDLLEKEKNSEVNRLLRQFEIKQGGNQKQMAYLIRKLEDQVKEKDHRYHDLLRERERLRRELDSQPVQRRDKSYLSQLMEKSRQATDTNNRALADSMNLIISKMAQLEKRNDQTIKKQLQALRKKSEDKRNYFDTDQNVKITELQKVLPQLSQALQKEQADNLRLLKEVDRLEKFKDEQGYLYSALEKKYKELQEDQQQLRDEIQEMSKTKVQLNNIQAHYTVLQQQIVTYTQTITSLQKEIQDHRQSTNSLIASHKQKEKKYDDEIRMLKRKLDEAQFQTQKLRQEAEFNLTLLRSSHDAEAKKVVEENAKLIQKLKEVQEISSATKSALQNQLKIKEDQISLLKNNNQALKQKGQEDLLVQRRFFETQMVASQNNHNIEVKKINQKFAALSTANERLLSQLSAFASKDAELNELRRVLRYSTTMSSGVSHLWEIKEAQYGNINQVLTSLRTV